MDRPVLTPPDDHKKVLLHSCCAPCSGEVMEAMTASGIDYTVFFYNPIYTPSVNMNCASRKISASHESTELLL